MKKIIYLIGLPASGKSTWIKENYPNSVVISNDIIVEEYAEKNNIGYNDAWKELDFSFVTSECFNRFNTAVSNKEDIIIIDNTNMTIKSRRKYIDNSYDREAVVFQIDEIEHNKRIEKRKNESGKYVPDDVIKNMKNCFIYPTKEENFKNIILITT